jgi:hypothetical protein
MVSCDFILYPYLRSLFRLFPHLFVIVASSTPQKVLESPSHLSPYQHIPTVGYSILLIISVGICLVGIFSILESKTQTSSKTRFTLSSSGVAFISISLIALIGFTILLRLGTLRLKKIPLLLQSSNSAHFPQSEIHYNHREMDELIFEVCMISRYLPQSSPLLHAVVDSRELCL